MTKKNLEYRIRKTENMEYPYNVQVLVDGIYCGNGRFCRSLEEARDFIAAQEEQATA